MKKSDRIARDLEQSVTMRVENAKDWATPRVEAAVDWAVPRLQHGLDTASPKIQEGLKSAAHNLADGVATVTPRIQDGLAQLAPRINDVVENASPRSSTRRWTRPPQWSSMPATAWWLNTCPGSRTRSAWLRVPCTAPSKALRPALTPSPSGLVTPESSMPSRSRRRPPAPS